MLGEAVIQRCDIHGVSALLCQRLGAGSTWPREVLERLRSRAAEAAIWEAHHKEILERLLAALATQNIEPILLKGTALAYSCYKDPALRTRSDTDLLVPETARADADAVLHACGFQRGTEVSGDVISYQAGYRENDHLGLAHAVDLHWRINNSEVLSRLFSYAELRSRTIPLRRLGGAAVATCPIDALMIACMHREVHRQIPYWIDGVAYFVPDRFIWLYDIHLLSQSLEPDAWSEFAERAREKGLAAICRDSLARTVELLETPLRPRFLGLFTPGRRSERPYVYLHASALRRQYMDFSALPDLSHKLKLLREMIFPPKEYMRARFDGVRPGWLPWLYARRAIQGGMRRLRGAWIIRSRWQ